VIQRRNKSFAGIYPNHMSFQLVWNLSEKRVFVKKTKKDSGQAGMTEKK
jgi:hypothetical protein